MSLFDDGTTRGDVVTVRPGRRLFVRRIVLGSHRPDGGSRATAAPPTLVFVHGSCATERQYHRLVKAMQDGHRDHEEFPAGTTCILYDLAGCGRSPPPTRARDDKEEGRRPETLGWVRQSWESLLRVPDGALYGNGESIQDLKAILSLHSGRRSSSSADEAASPLFLVGHSYASNLILPLALELLSASPDKGDGQAPPVLPYPAISISGVILLSCGMRTPGNPIPDGGSPLIRNVPVQVLNCMQPSLTSGFVSAAVHPDTARTHRDVVEDLVEYCNANRMEVVQAYHSQMKWFSWVPPPSPPSTTQPPQPSTPGDVRTAFDVGVPVLVLHGDQDNIIPIHVGQEMANALRQELVVVRNVSHMIMMERPAEVASHVRSFVVGRSS